MRHYKTGVHTGEYVGLGARGQGGAFLYNCGISVNPQKYVAIRKICNAMGGGVGGAIVKGVSRRLRQDVAAMRRSPASSASHESFFPPSSSSKNGLDGATASSWGNRTS